MPGGSVPGLWGSAECAGVLMAPQLVLDPMVSVPTTYWGLAWCPGPHGSRKFFCMYLPGTHARVKGALSQGLHPGGEDETARCTEKKVQFLVVTSVGGTPSEGGSPGGRLGKVFDVVAQDSILQSPAERNEVGGSAHV